MMLVDYRLHAKLTRELIELREFSDHIHQRRLLRIREERNYWRRATIIMSVVAVIAIVLMLIVSGNALDSQSVVAR